MFDALGERYSINFTGVLCDVVLLSAINKNEHTSDTMRKTKALANRPEITYVI